MKRHCLVVALTKEATLRVRLLAERLTQWQLLRQAEPHLGGNAIMVDSVFAWCMPRREVSAGT